MEGPISPAYEGNTVNAGTTGDSPKDGKKSVIKKVTDKVKKIGTKLRKPKSGDDKQELVDGSNENEDDEAGDEADTQRLEVDPKDMQVPLDEYAMLKQKESGNKENEVTDRGLGDKLTEGLPSQVIAEQEPQVFEDDGPPGVLQAVPTDYHYKEKPFEQEEAKKSASDVEASGNEVNREQDVENEPNGKAELEATENESIVEPSVEGDNVPASKLQENLDLNKEALEDQPRQEHEKSDSSSIPKLQEESEVNEEASGNLPRQEPEDSDEKSASGFEAPEDAVSREHIAENEPDVKAEQDTTENSDLNKKALGDQPRQEHEKSDNSSLSKFQKESEVNEEASWDPPRQEPEDTDENKSASGFEAVSREHIAENEPNGKAEQDTTEQEMKSQIEESPVSEKSDVNKEVSEDVPRHEEGSPSHESVIRSPAPQESLGDAPDTRELEEVKTSSLVPDHKEPGQSNEQQEEFVDAKSEPVQGTLTEGDQMSEKDTASPEEGAHEVAVGDETAAKREDVRQESAPQDVKDSTKPSADADNGAETGTDTQSGVEGQKDVGDQTSMSQKLIDSAMNLKSTIANKFGPAQDEQLSKAERDKVVDDKASEVLDGAGL